VDAALRDHITNEEWLLAGLTVGDRAVLAGLLRKLLTSEPFRALDPLPSTAEAPEHQGRRRQRVRQRADSDARRQSGADESAAASSAPARR
jgi:hypothetical protein